MRRIDFMASQPSYANHLLPVWAKIPEDSRGYFYTPPGEVEAQVRRAGVATVNSWRPIPDDNRPMVVAGMADMYSCLGLPICLVQHGAGMVYPTPNEAYTGGPHREPVSLFLNPGPHQARLDGDAYPQARSVAVGLPALDPWHSGERPAPNNPEPVIAITFHWKDVGGEWCWRHYEHVIPQLVARFGAHRLLGTGHPRYLASFRASLYERWGIEVVSDPAEVFDRADLLIADVTSLGFEFMSLDRPVVWVSMPQYSSLAGCWPRFSGHPGGIVCDQPDHLTAAVEVGLLDPVGTRGERREKVAEVYGPCDGRASERAVSALLSWAETAEATSTARGPARA